MKVSVIIPVWNGREYLPGCLDSLLAQDYPDFEVIVVDNASADSSADLVAEKYPQVRLIQNLQNLGFAGGCNVGLQVAQGDTFVLLNQDTIVRPGWLRALVKALQKPEVGVAGCKILYPNGKTIQHAGGWIEWPLGLAHHYGQGEQDDGQWDEPRQVDYVTGAAMAFRRDILEKAGQMDEEFWPGYFEDSDFCFRVREAGHETWYIPEAVIVHVEGISIRNPVEHSLFNERGRLRFVLKHMHPRQFLEEFIPAETKDSAPATQRPDGDPARLAYLEAIPMAARILPQRWNADEQTVEAVLLALYSLYYFPLSEARVGREEFPPLQEFEFHSGLPVIGPLIARFRNVCYNIAARWAIRFLIQQQTAINRQQGIINRQQGMMIVSLERRLTESSVFLSREIARLTGELENLKKRLKGVDGNG
ncbi:MAG: glycosyltransferase family 2 protein [Anaerolineae bacterium]|jgi:GT2 family glycosyltransferase|nr:glycosyltransferase family 2 protein [Anaerolineae bacterium]